MKLKDLLEGRDKLRKYDELVDWKKYFETNTLVVDAERCKHHYIGCYKWDVDGYKGFVNRLPDNIRKIIVDALDAEIKKMEEE